jgi:heme A synthase
MKNPWLHRFAILVATFALLLIVAGAWLSSEVLPLPGSPPDAAAAAAATTDDWASLAVGHRVLGDITGTLTIVLAVWLAMSGGASWLRNLGWAALAIVIAEAFLGVPSALQAYPRALGVVHALLAPIYFSVVIALAVFTSTRFAAGPELVDDKFGTLRKTVLWMIALVLVQIALGASYRYNVLGVIWHILNAMVVLILILVVGVLTLKQYPAHPALRPAALALVVIAGAQVLLGFATFLVLLMVSKNTPALVDVSMAHITIGAVTLAASVAMAIQIRYSIRAVVSEPRG